MPLLAYLGSSLTAVFAWFMAKYATGALKTVTIYTLLITALAVAIFSLVDWVNNLILELINTLSPINQNMVLGIAAFLPSNMPYLVGAILSYYLFTAGLHLTIQLATLKSKWADKALGAYK